MNLAGKNILVVGAGRSGLAAAKLCAGRGARVTLSDKRSAVALGSTLEGLDPAIHCDLGGHTPDVFEAADLIILSPGVPDFPLLLNACERGIPIWGELELGARFVRAPILAITGTNGKSTTTCLLAAMVEASSLPTFAGGNLGTPLCEAVGTPAASEGGALVVEVSSFQLEAITTFRPQVALLLNVDEDHLDRYPSFEAYKTAKARIFRFQRGDDVAVVNGTPGQEECRRLASQGSARLFTFGEQDEGTHSAFPLDMGP